MIPGFLNQEAGRIESAATDIYRLWVEHTGGNRSSVLDM